MKYVNLNIVVGMNNYEMKLKKYNQFLKHNSP